MRHDACIYVTMRHNVPDQYAGMAHHHYIDTHGDARPRISLYTR
jgi:hypothetical protein